MNTDNAVTVLIVVACVALGVFFGVEITARLAMAQFVGMPKNTVQTAWIQQAKMARWASVAAFGASSLAATALYARQQQ